MLRARRQTCETCPKHIRLCQIPSLPVSFASSPCYLFASWRQREESKGRCRKQETVLLDLWQSAPHVHTWGGSVGCPDAPSLGSAGVAQCSFCFQAGNGFNLLLQLEAVLHDFRSSATGASIRQLSSRDEHCAAAAPNWSSLILGHSTFG